MKAQPVSNLYVSGYEKRDHVTHLNFHFKTLNTWKV